VNFFIIVLLFLFENYLCGKGTKFFLRENAEKLIALLGAFHRKVNSVSVEIGNKGSLKKMKT